MKKYTLIWGGVLLIRNLKEHRTSKLRVGVSIVIFRCAIISTGYFGPASYPIFNLQNFFQKFHFLKTCLTVSPVSPVSLVIPVLPLKAQFF